MPKKKFAADTTHGYIGDSDYKAKPKPFTESPIITNYMALRDSFDWTLEPGPPKYEGPQLTLQEIFKESTLNEHGKLEYDLPAPKIKIETEQEEKDKNESKEFFLQRKICIWVNSTWPGTIFISDFAAGLHLSHYMAQQRSAQSCDDKYLDWTMMEPRGGYYGLVIEIKTEAGTPFKVDGKTMLKNKHTESQLYTINKLRKMGYCALFGVGEDQIKKIITKYKSFPATTPIKIMET